jgi:hypothetical protein
VKRPIPDSVRRASKFYYRIVDLPFAPYPGLQLYLTFTNVVEDIHTTSVFFIKEVEYDVRAGEFTCWENCCYTSQSEEQVKVNMAFEGFDDVWT